MSGLAETIHLLLRTGQISRIKEPELFSKAQEERETLEGWARLMGFTIKEVRFEGDVVGVVLTYGHGLTPARLRAQLDGRSVNQKRAWAILFFAQLLELLELAWVSYLGLSRRELEMALARRLSSPEEDPTKEALRGVLAGMERLLERRKKGEGLRVQEALEVLGGFLQLGERLGVFLLQGERIRPLPVYLWLVSLLEEHREVFEALGMDPEPMEEEGDEA